ncbi:hypothetical protein ZOSMA_31G01460 [Zostera marina]|uniref:Uncharacterized protein n=1 Tax=Zostera marina TaxID=29655 RepID=A0A0K9PBI2_ZOSMR|nr:hypothetical protein ZOSMA_31G01460 [Zostera marina]
MSSEIEEKSSFRLPESLVPAQIIQKTQKQPELLYSRDFLLSLRDLDICTELPSGFDESVLCEFLSVSNNTSEQQRNPTGLFFQNSKHNGYGQSTRVENSINYTKGSLGRWDTRSSGSSDREDVQTDRESAESGGRYLNPSRRSWQQLEHDGLLRKPSGYSGQASTQRTQGDAGYQLNKTTDPFQPSRSHKVVNYSRSSVNSFDAETFGSSDCSDQGRAEEEKKRRASFDLMRREQQKSLQEKRKQILEKQEDVIKSDITILPNKFENSQTVENSNTSKIQSNDSSRSFQLQASAPRPLVPPGFGSNAMESKLYPSTLNTSHSVEVGDTNVANTNPTNSANVIKNSFGKGVDEKDDVVSLGLKVSHSSSNDLPFNTLSLLKESRGRKDVYSNDSTNKNAVNVGATKVVDEDSKLILDKLFQNAFARSDERLSDFVEHRDPKKNQGAKSSSLSQSSKFSQFFLEDQSNLSTGLLSLVNNDDKIARQVSANKDVNIMEILSSKNASRDSISTDNSSIENEKASRDFTLSDKLSKVLLQQESNVPSNKPVESLDMFTCEYIEQLMLAEVNAENFGQQHLMSESLTSMDLRSEPQKNHVNDHASQHLLSLLHKEENPNDYISPFNQNTKTPSVYVDFPYDKPSNTESDLRDSVSQPTGMSQNTDGSLTLEGLFGSAFMKELQSVEAPLSAQRASVGGNIKSTAMYSGEPEYTQNAGLFSSAMKSSFVDDRVDIHLPEEDNLITIGDSINPSNPKFYHVKNEAKHELLPSNTQDSIADKITALNAGSINERIILPPPILDSTYHVHGSYDQKNLDPSHQQFSRHQINQTHLCYSSGILILRLTLK